MTMQKLCEAYRPKSWDEIVGQDEALGRIQAIEKRGFGGRAFWISGPSGSGKTTMARLIAATLADPLNIEEYDHAGDIAIVDLKEFSDYQATFGLGVERHGRAVIVNEAHGLRKDVVRKLLGMLERIPDHVAWIFTTTDDGADGFLEGMIDGNPLVSRCTEVKLHRDDEAFAQHARAIATHEGLNGKPLSAYLALATECRGNMRRMLQAIEAGELAKGAAITKRRKTKSEAEKKQKEKRRAAALKAVATRRRNAAKAKGGAA